MKEEKQILIDGIVEKLNASPFAIVTDYTGLTVAQFAQLRDQLTENNAKCEVLKNSFVKRAAKDIGLPDDFAGSLKGQTALVTGDGDVCATAKVLKTFAKATEKTEIRGGVLDGEVMDAASFNALADLPAREVLLAQLLGVLEAPASKLVRTLNEPAAALARVLAAKQDAA